MPKNLPREPIVVTSVRSLSKFFNVNERTAQRWIDQGCPGTSRKYDLYLVHRWLTERDIEEALRARRSSSDPSSGETTDLKARLDEVKIRKEDLSFLERCERLIPREHCQIAWNAVATHLRVAGELLRKHHGVDAQEILTEALNESQREVEQLFPDDSSSADTTL